MSRSRCKVRTFRSRNSKLLKRLANKRLRQSRMYEGMNGNNVRTRRFDSYLVHESPKIPNDAPSNGSPKYDHMAEQIERNNLRANRK